jgi:beta-galactosidase/beta-glucuronidase
MRKIAIENGKVYLNNEPYFLRMILDQGYWPDGIYTPRSIADLEYDVEMTKKFGFNTARKHQKFEDPYYYYYCDKLGLLTWCEMAACYHYDEEISKNITDEWQRLVIRHYNHPSVIAWVPINESWGVDQLSDQEPDPRLVSHMQTMYHLTKSLDPTRLVIGNDGWQMAETDIIAIHEYTQDAEDFKRRYAQFKVDPYSKAFSHGRPIMLPGFTITDQPIMITEFGGVKIQDGNLSSWGYGDDAKDVEDMLARVEALVSAILEQREVAGYCYTQLTDVEQEVNGLLTFDRKPKADPERIAKIFV